MSQVRRVFVEKKKGFDVEAHHMFTDLKVNVGLKGLTNLRLINRYDVQGLTDDEYQKARGLVFSEPMVDTVYDEVMDVSSADFAFAMEYLPGQYDQRADSASQCVQLLTQGAYPLCRTAKIILLYGNLTQEEFDRIRAYIINPVDSRQASFDKPQTLDMQVEVPEDVSVFDGFIDLNKEQLNAFMAELGLAMSLEDILHVQNYFKDEEKRDPTVTEIRVLDTYWSDHCRHTTFATQLDEITIEKSPFTAPMEEAYEMYKQAHFARYHDRTDKPICLMDIATMGMKELRAQGHLENIEISGEINACSIVVKADIDGKQEDWLVMFKNETHNHPTEIEPFGGAATCLGGAIRDPLSGRSYVYQAMRITGSGDPTVPVKDTTAGKLPQRKITTTAAAGYSSYGNQIGLATGKVHEIYDEGYIAKRMELGAVIGAAPLKNVIREVPAEGDIIILLGGRTGRDGCGGATGSSKAHTEESITTCGAEVQKGSPPTERKIQRLFRNPKVSQMIKRCNDFGAGGVCVAIGELAEGLTINLDAVPKKYEGLDGTELAISESQERMAVVVSPQDVQAFMDLADSENLETTHVAVVTDDARLTMAWRGKTIVSLSRAFLDTNGATQHAKAHVVVPKIQDFFATQPMNDVKASWLKNLADLNVCSQKGLVERFDSSIGAGTVLMPFGGKNQLTPSECMVGKLPILHGETTTGTAMSHGYNPQLSKASPFHGAVYAVVEALSKIVAVGAAHKDARLTLQEYFERLGQDPTRWGKPLAALLGAFYAQMKMKTAAIGGKDSMSGSFHELDVPPTLVAFAVNTMNIKNVISPEFKKANSRVLLLKAKQDSALLPDFDNLHKQFEAVTTAISNGKVLSCATIGMGGLSATLTKMCFGNDFGMAISAKEDWFMPMYGSFVLEVKPETDLSEFEGLDMVELGKTTEQTFITVNGIKINLQEALSAWQNTLEGVFPTHADELFGDIPKPMAQGKRVQKPKVSLAKPKVLILTFPGNNCEYDSARAFEKAGAIAEIFVVRNLTPQAIEKTILHMEKAIRSSQILMIPGGFSGGDEPDGAGKFIATTLRNPRVKDAVMDLLQKRDGLALGICNGFQALIKLGLVPFGEIRDMDENSPTLTFNEIGRHASCMVNTRIASTNSPWLSLCKAGDMHTVPISHGEGRFVASEEVLKALYKNGQIATQYVDLQGNPTYDIRYNPNGSVWAIEGILSPDGRVFGKMAHSERAGKYVAQNVQGNKNQEIFKAGVSYFK